jgi:myosin-5
VELKTLGQTKYRLKVELDEDTQSKQLLEGTFSSTDANVALPAPRNTTLKEDRLDDLTALSYLTEPAVLNCIKQRYFNDTIYTYSGLVLVAVNPYCRLGLYEEELIEAYAGKNRGELEPHLFAVAEDAYRSMLRDGANQSIVISGESGAGKTISARYVMRYFAAVESKERSLNGQASGADATALIEERVLCSNPILEAFGNAKTTRNDNSSRFGKYVQIFFDRRQREITGAAIKTYLLEKTRVVGQAAGERNYHIFYQLLSGIDEETRKQLRLDGLGIKDFAYLNGGGDIEDVDDAKEFRLTCDALKTAGFSSAVQMEIFKALSAILHLGNVQFEIIDAGTGTDEAVQVTKATRDSLERAADLLGARQEELAKWLTHRQLVTKIDSMELNLSLQQARGARDAIAKHLYARLFDLIVRKMNELLEPKDKGTLFIGVLDIYGFERFEHNSFEQFCINYANERLQHQFNQSVFKLEQELYQREAISWSFINYADNQPCIDLIEGRGGVLDLLDEECRFPNGSDRSFLDKVHREAVKVNEVVSDYLLQDPMLPQETFTVRHFAYDVSYNVEAFLEKNRDFVPVDALKALGATEESFVSRQILGLESLATDQNEMRKSTGLAFKQSLHELMTTIHSTHVHYIRCIKPNNSKSARSFEAPFVMQQLRAGGIIETIKISAAGYPARWQFEEFYHRYRLLNDQVPSVGDWRREAEELLKSISRLTADDYQLGKTRIFMRAGIVAELERERSLRVKQAALEMQAAWRRYREQLKLHGMQEAAMRIQAAAKALLARIETERNRREAAVTLMQTAFRSQTERRKAKLARESVQTIQSQCRWKLSRSSSQLAKKPRQTGHDAKKGSDSDARTRTSAHTAHGQNAGVEAACEDSIEAARIAQLLAELERTRLENAQLRFESKKAASLPTSPRFAAPESRLHVEGLEEMLESAKAENLRIHAAMIAMETTIGNLQEEKVFLSQACEQIQAELEKERAALNLSRAERERALLAEKEVMETRLKKMESVVRNLMVNQVVAGFDRGEQAADGMDVDRAGSKSSLLGILQADQTRLVKFPGESDVLLAELLRADQVLTELLQVIETSTANSFELAALPALVLFKWLDLSTRVSDLAELTESRLIHCLDAVREKLSSSTDDRKCAFWLNSLVQLHNAVNSAILEKEQNLMQVGDNVASQVSISAVPAPVLLVARAEIGRLAGDIFYAWERELEKWFGRAAIAAILDHQSLANYKVPEERNGAKKGAGTGSSFSLGTILGFGGGEQGKRIRGKDAEMDAEMDMVNGYGSISLNSTAGFGPDALIAAFEELLGALDANRLPQDLQARLVSHLNAHLAVTCFNQFLLKRNFVSWKRAIQVQYNLTRFLAWAEVQLDTEPWLPLMEAVKVVQLAKTPTVDGELLMQCAPSLSTAQIKRVLRAYQPDEYEDEGPIASRLMKVLSPLSDQVSASAASLVPTQEPDRAVFMQTVPSERLVLSGLNGDGMDEGNSVSFGTNCLPVDMPPTLWKLFLLFSS